MEYLEPGDSRRVEALRRIAEQQRRELDLPMPDWPVYGLADPPDPGWLGGWTRQDGVLTTVEVCYGQPTTHDLTVYSQPLSSQGIRSLDWLLAEVFVADGSDYPVSGSLPMPSGAGELPAAPRAEPSDVTVDGTPLRPDERLRRRAIDEVIWVTATGEDTVGSAAAQRRWPTGSSHRDGPVRDRIRARDAALAVWQEWADRA